MADDYQNMEHHSLVGFSLESTYKTDPLAGGSGNRVLWPGRVLRIPTLNENYLFEKIRSLGGGPDPQLIVKGGEEFAIEIEFNLQRLFSDLASENDEIISAAFGRIAADGSVTMRRPLPRWYTIERGWTNPGTQADTITVTGNDDGTYTVNINGTDYSHVASSETVEQIRDALVTAIGSPTGVTVGTSSTDVITLTAAVEGTPFSDGVTNTDGNLSIVRTYASWYQVMRGCKIDVVSLSVRQNETVKARLQIVPTEVDFNLAPVTTSGTGLLDLTEHTLDPAHYSHVTVTLTRLSDSVAFTPLLKEFDISMSNNISRVPTISQTYAASRLKEGVRETTVSLRTDKNSTNVLQDLARARPQDTDGRFSMAIVIAVSSGFYMSWTLPVVNLMDPSRDTGFNQDVVEEGFAAELVGAPTLDMAV